MKPLVLIFSMNGINASMSSRDAQFYFECETRSLPVAGEAVGFGPSPSAIVDKVYSDGEADIVVLKNDTRFCVGRLGHDSSKTPAFLAVVNKYIAAGWVAGYPAICHQFWQRRAVEASETARMAGYVNWRDSIGEPTPLAERFGGFSPFVTDNPQFRRYIAGTVFGWLGSRSRTQQIDALLEELFRERGLTSDEIYSWVSSTEGRHFGDYLDDLPLNKQAAYIRENIGNFCNSAMAYSDPNHKGTLRSTIELKQRNKDLGVAFPEKPTEFSTGAYWKNPLDGES